jgi:hypothetical protein
MRGKPLRGELDSPPANGWRLAWVGRPMRHNRLAWVQTHAPEANYWTRSFSALSAVARTFLLAGFAGMVIGSLVKGLMP